MKTVLKVLTERIKAGADIKTPWVSVGIVPTALGSPEQGELVTNNHMALIHSSFRYPKKDKEFGRPMYVVHALIKAQDMVLDRVDYVKYILDGFPNPVETCTDRSSRFKLKELTSAEFTLRAEVKIKGQQDIIKLSRYINLTETGPRI